ncbi:SET domain-containing protein [Neptuniibacter sp.]|uniref:SET domain-containing protein n=1 Tax=Neptuniibacter sp. TaxID=1962643 RepID=UPI003B5ADFF8
MLNVDTGKVQIGDRNSKMKGVFATQEIQEGETILFEGITVYESINTTDAHVPSTVRLALRIIADGHLDRLYENGFDPNLWNVKTPKHHKIWLRKAIESKIASKQSVMNAYNIACAYNICVCYNQGSSPDGSQHLYKRAVISPISCKINHSCEPNSRIWTTNDPSIVKQRLTGFIATETINKGDEITFFYLEHIPDELTDEMPENLKSRLQPQHWDVKSRRREIKKQFGFLCECSRCKRESEKHRV